MRMTLALTLLLPAATGRQVEPPPAGYRIEERVRDRWMHGRQRPEFTPYFEGERFLRIDSVRVAPGNGARTFHLDGRLEWSTTGRPARITTDRVGRLLHAEPALESPHQGTLPAPTDSARRSCAHAFAGDRHSLGDSCNWELMPAFHPPRPVRGARWVDTLDLRSEQGLVSQTMHGVRVSTLLGDTLVAGRRLWIVRDSAYVRYDVRWSEEERSLDAVVTLQRQVEGVIRGRYLYDPAFALYTLRHDTTAVAGTAVLHYPDGRVFRTPARYERTRHVELHDSASYLVRLAEIRRAAAEEFGVPMVTLPQNDVERRLHGDIALADSIVGLWHRSRDPQERKRLHTMLVRWGPRTRDFHQNLRDLALQAGDTAQVASIILDGLGYPSEVSTQITEQGLGLLLPFLRDPGLAFAHGLNRDGLYSKPVAALLRFPPVTRVDTAWWPCTPEACWMLARQWGSAGEARLRDLALITHLVLEPAAWADEVTARAAGGSMLSREALGLIHEDPPLPAPGADWRAWLAWVGRGSDRDDGVNTVLRFQMARTGRDLVGEFRQELTRAETDSAQLVYSNLLLDLDAYRPDTAQVVARIKSANPALRALGKRELYHLFYSPERADPATTTEILDRLFAIVIEGAESWPVLEGQPERTARVVERQVGPWSEPVLILADSLPPEFQERWRGRAQLITDTEWRQRSNRLPALLFTPGPVLKAGPFAVVALESLSQSASDEDGTVGGAMWWLTLFLLRTEKGWVILASEEVVT